MNSADLAAAGIGTTDLGPLIGDGVGFRRVRNVAANRYKGSVTVFLYGPPDAQTGRMEIDDITSVRFLPGNPVTPAHRSFVNDYTASQASADGLSLFTGSRIDVSLRPDGKIAVFFMGNLSSPLEGKCFLQVW